MDNGKGPITGQQVTKDVPGTKPVTPAVPTDGSPKAYPTSTYTGAAKPVELVTAKELLKNSPKTAPKSDAKPVAKAAVIDNQPNLELKWFKTEAIDHPNMTVTYPVNSFVINKVTYDPKDYALMNWDGKLHAIPVEILKTFFKVYQK